MSCPAKPDECSEKWRQHHLGDEPCTEENIANCLKWRNVSPSKKIQILKEALKKIKEE